MTKITFNKITFEDFLEERFIARGEWNETGITKDNFESGFEQWLEQLDNSELMEYAELAMNGAYLEGKAEVIKAFSSIKESQK